jgi:hypothetical protein
MFNLIVKCGTGNCFIFPCFAVEFKTTLRRLVEENRTYQMSEWMKQKPFLCLNPTQKSEILAFLCNELLNNKVSQCVADPDADLDPAVFVSNLQDDSNKN